MTNTKVPGGLRIEHVSIATLKPAEYNPRTWDKKAENQLKESITSFGIVEPLIVNSAPERKGVVIGGHFRLSIIKQLGIEIVPVLYINIPDLEREKQLNLRLNKNRGAWDETLLEKFDETFLSAAGFTSEELDDIFTIDITPKPFDLEEEVANLDHKRLNVEKGDMYDLSGSRLVCGDPTIGAHMRTLIGKNKVDLCLTSPPYLLHGRRKKSNVVSSTPRWMAHVQAAAKDDFHIIVFEDWQHIRHISDEMEKYWQVKNMLVWHVGNRGPSYSANYKFSAPRAIAMVGSSNVKMSLNTAREDELLQNVYESALHAMQGKPYWGGYEKDMHNQPTDFIEHGTYDRHASHQGIRSKPVDILIPYIKVLTKRGDLVLDPFGGSGSTLIASIKMQRRCYVMEESPLYASVILNRWSQLTGLIPKKV